MASRWTASISALSVRIGMTYGDGAGVDPPAPVLRGIVQYLHFGLRIIAGSHGFAKTSERGERAFPSPPHQRGVQGDSSRRAFRGSLESPPPAEGVPWNTKVAPNGVRWRK